MATRTKLLRPTQDGSQTEWYTVSSTHSEAVDNEVVTGAVIPTGTLISALGAENSNKQDEFQFHPSGSDHAAGTSTLGSSSIVTLTSIVVHTAGSDQAADSFDIRVSINGGSTWTAAQTVTHAVGGDWKATTFTTGVSGTRNDDNLDIRVEVDSTTITTDVEIYVLYIVVTGTDTGLMTKILRPVGQGVNTDWTGTYADIDDAITNPAAGGTATKIYTNANVNESVLLAGNTFGIYKMQTIESNIYAENDKDSGDNIEVDIDFKYDGSFTSHSTEQINDGSPAWESTSIGSTERERGQFGGNLEMDFDNVGDTGNDDNTIYVAYAKVNYRPQQPG